MNATVDISNGHGDTGHDNCLAIPLCARDVPVLCTTLRSIAPLRVALSLPICPPKVLHFVHQDARALTSQPSSYPSSLSLPLLAHFSLTRTIVFPSHTPAPRAAIIFAALLCSNHITYRFGKGMMPKAYRLIKEAMAVIVEKYAT
ncbi:hypothetical protein C8J57DRAFT_1528005 [Mycena rebaudengoi]|nr:hypothetical protein C8J57DRAFT_1528005 [Mycena rebaudengoi]